MRIFDVITKGIITYGAEQWGWKERKEIEKIQMKYIRWTLKLNRNTPWHTIRKETERRKILHETAKRAMRFDMTEEDSWEKACWKQIRDRNEEEWSKGKREREGNGKRELLEKVGLSIKEWNSLQREEDKIEELLKRLEGEEKEEIRKEQKGNKKWKG